MKTVILAGGAGLRLWPLSRKEYPKQFLSLEGDKSLFLETIERNKAISDSFVVITNDSYRFITEKELSKAEDICCEYIYETIGRNTAPAISIAAMRSEPKDIIFVVASDASIKDLEKYKKCVAEAEKLAKEGYIVTFGIKPTFANTEYGYIKYSGNDVVEFKEKPDAKTAKEYFESKEYLWNSGMFMFEASVLLDELKKYRSDIYESCKNIVEAVSIMNNPTLPKALMEMIPSESIDYAVMEKSDRVKVIPSDFSWNDVGGLEAVSELISAYDETNTAKGENIIMNECKNTSVINDAVNKLVVVNGVEDVVVANTNNAIYVSKKGVSQKIKQVITNNEDKYGAYFNENVVSYRPWGYYEILENAPRFKVKSIVVYPGKRLSLQKHNFRSEHWIVVKGTAFVTIGDEQKECNVSESVYIPIGEIHRLENKTEELLEIIEIATGSYISEDDIVRIEDDFGR